MAPERDPSRQRGSRVLVAAGIYNILWGTVVVLAPDLGFQILGMESPRYPSIWQCVGMIVGVFGVGYLIAARNPQRHWPIVLVGFLGKVFGPIGFVFAASSGELPWRMGLTIITNDLIWLTPFAAILWSALDHAQMRNRADTQRPLESALAEAVDQFGVSVLDRSGEHPVLLVLLRHAGCIFCKETLADIAARRRAITEGGMGIVLVHMGDDATMSDVAREFGLDDLPRVSDPTCDLYQSLEVLRGTLRQLLGPIVWIRGVAALLSGHRVGRLAGDGLQLPGTFVISDGRVIRAQRHASAAERPDFDTLVCPIGA